MEVSDAVPVTNSWFKNEIIKSAFNDLWKQEHRILLAWSQFDLWPGQSDLEREPDDGNPAFMRQPGQGPAVGGSRSVDANSHSQDPRAVQRPAETLPDRISNCIGL